MNTWAEFRVEHEGHELHEPGRQFPGTVGCFYSGSTLPVVGEATCPLCAVKEKVIVDGKICKHHERGEHIKIRCKKCGTTGTTKNIDFIGARTIFVDCQCEEPEYEHMCEDRNV